MTGRDAACEFRDEHPELRAQLEQMDRRVDSIERWREQREEARVSDIREFTSKLDELHGRVTAVGADVAGLKGRLVILPLVGTAAGGVLLFLLQSLFAHVAR